MRSKGLSQGIISLIAIILMVGVLFVIYELYIAPTTGRYCKEVIFTPDYVKLVKGCSSPSGFITYQALNPYKEPIKLTDEITICLLTDRGRLSCSNYRVNLNRTVLSPGNKLIFKVGFLIKAEGVEFNMTSSWFTDSIFFTRAVKSLKYFTTASWIWYLQNGTKVYYEAGIACKNYISSGEVGYSGGGGAT